MTNKLLGRVLIVAGIVVLSLLFAWEAFSEELSVVEVRRNIPLADNDPVFQDFYLNSGSNEGLKLNMVVTAARKVTVHDSTGTQTYGDLLVPVGQIKVIAIGEKFAVARLHKEISREEQPMLEQTGIMIGDKISLDGSFIDNQKGNAKKAQK